MNQGIAVWIPSPHHRYHDHPEGPHRLAPLEEMRDQLPVTWVDYAPATEDEIALAHRRSLLDWIRSACQQGPAIIDYAPTYITGTTYQDARNAAGGLLTVTRRVLQGQATWGFALVRPPGHHATATQSMGFCIFNNVAIAAKAALQEGCRRVAIVDFDAHHGNGTQDIVWKEERIGFFSSQQQGIYPGTGDVDEAPHARGRILNAPVPARTGDEGYRRLFEEVVAPWLRQWRPDLILVSAGFDAHWQDPLTHLGLTATGFAQIVEILKNVAQDVCQGKLVFTLEGGYHPPAVALSIRCVMHVMAGKPLPAEADDDQCPFPEPDIASLCQQLKQLHFQ